MKLNTTSAMKAPKAEQSAVLSKNTTATIGDSAYFKLLALIADVLDTAIMRGDCYMIIGTTKDRSACSLTVVQGSDRGAVYGSSLEDLAQECEKLL